MSQLRIAEQSTNYYENAYLRLSRDPDFNKDEWTSIAKGNNILSLDDYITVKDLALEKDVTESKILDIYNGQFSTLDNKLAALQNEVYANKNNKDTERERYVYDENGQIVTNDTGKPLTEKYVASDYDYYKDIIKYNNQLATMQREEDMLRQRKDSINGFVKFLNNSVLAGGEFVSGIANGLDNFVMFCGAIDSGIKADGKDWNSFAKGFVEHTANYAKFSQEFQDSIQQWEIENASMRNLDGSFTDTGKIVSGIASSLGEMFPSLVLSVVTGGVGGALSKSATTVTKGATTLAKVGNVISKVGSVAATSMFYSQMTADNVRTMQNKFAKDTSVTASHILINAAAKSAMQLGIELALGKLMGGTTLDNLVFGRRMGTISAKSLTAAGATRIIKDAIQEGLEEVLQTYSDRFVDMLFESISSDFGTLTDTSFKAISDAFIIGALSSLVGASAKIISSRRISTSQIQYNKEGVAKSKGDGVKYKKLNALASFEYKMDMKSFIEAYSSIEQLDTESQKDFKEYESAYKTMYTCGRLISSMYNIVGDKVFENANNILIKISRDGKNNMFDPEDLKIQSKKLYNKVMTLPTVAKLKSLDKLQKDIEHKKLKNILAIFKKDGTVEGKLEETTKEKLKKLAEESPKIENIVIAETGQGVVETEDKTVLIVPKAEIEEGVVQVQQDVAEQRVMQLIIDLLDSPIKELNISVNEIMKIAKTTIGKDNCTIEEVIFKLLMDSQFFSIVLATSNTDMYRFITLLYKKLDSIIDNNVQDAIFKNRLVKILNNWNTLITNYCVITPIAEIPSFLSAENVQMIEGVRYLQDIYKKASSKMQLTKNQIQLLTYRINSLTFAKTVKEQFINTISNPSASSTDITKVLNTVNVAYNYQFDCGYNNIHYFVNDSLANRTANAFLIKNDYTMDQIATLSKQEADAIFVQFSNYCWGRYEISRLSAKNGAVTWIVNSVKQYNEPLVKNNKNIKTIFTKNKNSIGINNSSYIMPIEEYQGIIEIMVGENVDKSNIPFLTINDLLYSLDLLDDSIKDDINKKYNQLTTYTAYLYLRDFLRANTDGIMLLLSNDGRFVLGNVVPALKMVKKGLDINNIDWANPKLKVEDIIDERYLNTFLKSIKLTTLQVASKDTDGYYTMYKDEGTLGLGFRNELTLYTGKRDSSDILLTFMHEFMHAVQTYNNLSVGINNQVIENLFKSQNIKDIAIANALIEEFKQYYPRAVINEKGEKRDKIAIGKEIAEIIYISTAGELHANAMLQDEVFDMMPFIVGFNEKGEYYLTTPLGNKYILSKFTRDFSVTPDADPDFLKSIIVFGKMYKMNTSVIERIIEQPKPITTQRPTTAKAKTNEITVITPSRNSTQKPVEKPIEQSVEKTIHKANTTVDTITPPTGEIKQNTITAIDRDSNAYKDRLRKALISLKENEEYTDIVAKNYVNLPREYTTKLLKVFYSVLTDSNFIYMDFLKTRYPFVIYDGVKQCANFGANDSVTLARMVSEKIEVTEDFKDIYFESANSGNTNMLIIGNCTPGEFLAYVNNGYDASILPTAKIFKVNKTDDNMELINEKGEIINMDSYSTNLGPSNPIDNSKKPNIRKPKTQKPKKTKIETSVTKSGAIKTVVVHPDGTREKPNYKYQKRGWYISKELHKNTNLKYFKTFHVNPDLQSFVINANLDKLDTYLVKILKSGDLTMNAIYDYVRESDMDEYTFSLLNKYIFQNPYINSYDELKSFVERSDEYWAIRVSLESKPFKDAGLDKIFENVKINNEVLDGIIHIINKDPQFKIYYDILSKYDSYSYYDTSIGKMSTKDTTTPKGSLKIGWMRHFKGTINSAGMATGWVRTALSRNWNVTGKIKEGVSLDANVGDTDGATFAERICEEDYSGLFEDITDEDIRDEFLTIAEHMHKKNIAQKVYDMLKNKIKIDDKIRKEFNEETKSILEKLEEKYLAMYDEYYKKGDIPKLRNTLYEYIRQLDSVGAFETVENNYKKAVDKLYYQVKSAEVTGNYDIIGTEADLSPMRTATSTVQTIKTKVKRMIARMNKKEIANFAKSYSNLFNGDGTIKDEAYKVKNSKGEFVYKDLSELLELNKLLTELSKQISRGVFRNARSLQLQQSYQKYLDKKVVNIEKSLSKEKVIIKVNTDIEIEVKSTKDIPPILNKLLQHEFTHTDRYRIQELREGNYEDRHMKTQLNKFIENNAEILSAMTQTDVDSIIEFYTHSEIFPETNKARTYEAIQLALLTYIIAQDKNNTALMFKLTEEQKKTILERITAMVSISAEILANWKTVLPTLRPQTVLMNSLAKHYGIEYDNMDKDIAAINQAIKTGNLDEIQEAKQNFYDGAASVFKSRKRSIFNKLLQFERAAMLSSPGTWIRNQVSNVFVTMGDNVGEHIGKVIMNLFPKNVKERNDVFSLKSKQYTLTGTIVTDEVKDFIQKEIIDSGLLKLVEDGLSKYDLKHGLDTSYSDQFTQMIVDSVMTNVTRDFATTGKVSTVLMDGLYKMLSDNPFIKRQFLRYLGKMLTEDSYYKRVNLKHGLTANICSVISEAYQAACWDYMHKDNAVMRVENFIREKGGPKAYFIYKQVFPFLSASWNWFIEGLNYTPVGLVKAIRDFVKLENYAEHLDKLRNQPDYQGQRVITSRLSKYWVTRRIGKGVIGSIGFVIGALLAGVGVARIDLEDDKWKIKIGNVYVDISDIFGSQGILMGIATIGPLVDKNADAGDLIVTVLNQMFNNCGLDSFINTLRFTDGIGGQIANMPFSVISMFVPNIIKTLNIFNKYKVNYEDGFLGKLEKLVATSIPPLSYALPHYIDPYTGEKQVQYDLWLLTNFFNKISPLDVYPYKLSDAEIEAISLGQKLGNLTGKYKVDNVENTISGKDLEELNILYGKLNKKDYDKLLQNHTKHTVRDAITNQFVDLTYSQMTDTQKASVLKSIASKNALYAKIKILTSNDKYKYYATESEYENLKKLGILKNVYLKTEKYSGFVPIN